MMKKKKKQKAQAVKHRKVQKIRLGYLSADLGQGRLRELLPMFFMAYDAFRYEILLRRRRYVRLVRVRPKRRRSSFAAIISICSSISHSTRSARIMLR